MQGVTITTTITPSSEPRGANAAVAGLTRQNNPTKSLCTCSIPCSEQGTAQT